MANNNLPAHDFAPAWLKIPTYDCHKPSGASVGDTHHTSRKDDHWFIRRDREPSSHSRYPFADSRWERDTHHSGDRKATFFPSRHQSIDIDDGQSSSSSSSSGGSSTFYPVGTLSNSNSQPSLLLRRPSSRHDFRDSSNSFNKGNSSHFGEVNSNGNVFKAKGHSPNSENRSNGTTEGIDASSNNFNQEFPSLKGNAEETKIVPPCGLNGSVWENPRNAKVHGVSRKVQLVHKTLKSEFKEGRSKSPLGLNGTTSSCISPKLNPQVAFINQPGKLNASSNSSNMTIFRALIPAKRQPSPLNPPTQNMEILVKNPKMRGNKSEFLKALRSEAGVNKHNLGNGDEELTTLKEINHRPNETSALTIIGEGENIRESNGCDIIQKEIDDDHPYENGIDINKLSLVDDNMEYDSKPLLSSSLEAEQRLLREMGWKEDGSDDDAYAPLTEDELKEFQVLSEKVAQKRNGLQRNQQINWSPKRAPSFPSVVLPPTENWSSSSESDSDSD